MRKTRIAIALGALLLSSSAAQAANHFDAGDIYNGKGVKLFAVGEVNGHNGFRIPAITTAGNGVLIAAADVRYMGSGWSDIVSDGGVRKTKISTKVSFDGGLTWSDLSIHNAKEGVADDDYMALATDPALLYDEKTDTAYMFGLRNNVNLVSGDFASKNPDNVQNIPQQQSSDFIMFTSKDKGQTWTSKSIYNDILAKVNVGNTGGKKYSIVFQGPGGGMSYNGKIYVPIQAWATNKDLAPGTKVMTSGFMVSEDGGENWEVSSMLIPDVTKNTGTAWRPNTSESNIFHYKGKIRLAVRHESAKGSNPSDNTQKLRLCYEYDEQTKTWTEVEEAFIPKDVAIVETSSHNLSEDVYLVGYTSYYNYMYAGNPNRRKGQTLATNTGIKLSLSDDVSEGYTSISSDDANIYVMYEGKIDQHDIFFKAIDWKHRDYANLNTQIKNRSKKVGQITEKYALETAYISASYGSMGGGGRPIRKLWCT